MRKKTSTFAPVKDPSSIATLSTSGDRILTTHVGSLPRSEPLLQLLLDKEQGKGLDEQRFEAQVQQDLAFVLRKQSEVGVDIPSDGELPRLGFSFYVKDRMTGFGGQSQRGTVTDFAKFPGYARLKAQRAPSGEAIGKSATLYVMPACLSAVHYDEHRHAAHRELHLFRHAVTQLKETQSPQATFVTAASPGIVSTTLLRDPAHPHYHTDRDYVLALADALRQEYELIVEHGHILQLDAPDLALERQIMFVDRPLDEFLRRVELHIEAINRAVVNIPRERVRLHVCWGNWDGPHLDDIDLEPLLPLLYQAKIGGLSLPFANPRHQHEIKLLKRYPLPRGMVLIPGLIDVTTNYLEHPEVIADRIENIANMIGDPRRIIAGTDCGFSTFAGYVMVAEDVVWEKLRMLSAGAALATTRLFS
jgi:5-methyltetrahydropteroyltriglutamate--homocysteine methyltransferase